MKERGIENTQGKGMAREHGSIIKISPTQHNAKGEPLENRNTP
jgi:hypothetical protein